MALLYLWYDAAWYIAAYSGFITSTCIALIVLLRHDDRTFTEMQGKISESKLDKMYWQDQCKRARSLMEFEYKRRTQIVDHATRLMEITRMTPRRCDE